MVESGTSTDDPADAAYGALLGACVEDAAGALLEFIYHMPTAEEVRQTAAGTAQGS